VLESGCWGWRCRWNGWGHVGTVSGRESFVVSLLFLSSARISDTIFIYCFPQNGSVYQTMAASAAQSAASSAPSLLSAVTGTAAGGAVAGGIVGVVTGAVIWRLGLGYRLVLCLTITVAAMATAGLGGNSVRTLLQTTHLRRSTRYIHRNSTRGTIDEEDLRRIFVDRYNDFSVRKRLHRLMQLDSG
jgi:hypothetical protein